MVFLPIVGWSMENKQTLSRSFFARVCPRPSYASDRIASCVCVRRRIVHHRAWPAVGAIIIIYLCRAGNVLRTQTNPTKNRAEAAKSDLECQTGKTVFEILIIDLSDLDSVKRAVDELEHPIKGLVLNAGGFGSPQIAMDVDKDGVLNIVKLNLLGHAYLVALLLKEKKLSTGSTVVYAGSRSGAPGKPE